MRCPTSKITDLVLILGRAVLAVGRIVGPTLHPGHLQTARFAHLTARPMAFGHEFGFRKLRELEAIRLDRFGLLYTKSDEPEVEIQAANEMVGMGGPGVIQRAHSSRARENYPARPKH